MQPGFPLTLPPSSPSCPRTWGAWGCRLGGPAGRPSLLPWWREGRMRATVQATRREHLGCFGKMFVHLVEHDAYLDPRLSRNNVRSTPTKSLQHLNIRQIKNMLTKTKEVTHTMALSASIGSPPSPLGWPASTLPRCRATSTRSGNKAISRDEMGQLICDQY